MTKKSSSSSSSTKKKSKFDSWSQQEKDLVRNAVLSIHELFPTRTPNEILKIYLQEDRDEGQTIGRLIMMQEDEMMLSKSSSSENDTSITHDDTSGINQSLLLDQHEHIPEPQQGKSSEEEIVIIENEGVTGQEKKNINSEDQMNHDKKHEEEPHECVDDDYELDSNDEIHDEDVDIEEEEIVYRDPNEDEENVFACDDNDNIVIELVDASTYDEEQIQSQTIASELRRNAVDPNYIINISKEEETLEHLWEQYKKRKQDSKSYKVLIDEYDIMKEQETEIQHTKDLLQLNPVQEIGYGDDFILAMLKQYRWRVESFSHDYWEHGEEFVCKKCGVPCEAFKAIFLGESGSDSSQNIQCNEEEDDPTCPACFCDDVPMRKNPVCGHRFCEPCWRGYLEVKIKEISGLGQTRINCMECNTALTQDFIFSFFSNAQTFNAKRENERIKMKYIENRVDTYVNDHFMVTRCPNAPGCKCVIKKTVDIPLHKVRCVPCDTLFCFQCGKSPHYPATCEMFEEFSKKSSSMTEGASYDFIQKNTKPCPKCKRLIDKNGGCNHMTCSMCHHEFCWLCFGNWHNHNFEACKEKIVQFTSETLHLDKSGEIQQKLYKHYIYYQEKMGEHNRWLERERSNHYMKNQLQQFKADVYVHTDVPYKYLFWVDEALKTVKIARRFLYGAYVYAFCAFNMELVQLDIISKRSGHDLIKKKKIKESQFALFDTHISNLEKAVSHLLVKLDFMTDNSWSNYMTDVSKMKIYAEQYIMKPHVDAVTKQVEGLKSVIENIEMSKL
ncbi:hypothetical protein FDP41_013665 [Naegleria fowleri]|uniref:RBR-type E3 ubiquitin transferase n=1 Tax=Naegleria fowleri TaxID=5763 RepID=A0A6A5C0L0_NAEFO|nr:uncharacterized protein FDP41_013665 [Naegleria fowleri]KAF0980451.1 hypothetical protein FDP41_013665 [Naegleria fowleri]CAG4714602.1 unnamed protein product [Naegleria fowleri]